MDDSIREGLACVGTYPRLRQANERALVIAAMGLPYWVFCQESHFLLYVENAHSAQATEELALYEIERRQNPFRRIRRLGHAARTSPSASLFVFTWVLALSFLVQHRGPSWLTSAGELSPKAVLTQGEWWRVVTALTLHADLGHLGANLATGICFAFFLLPLLGTGVTWSAILLSGALGNLLNAWFYRSEPHFSIGASTAVFGALGILVGAQIAAQTATSRTRLRLWEIILPIGAGAALLAYLGVGDKEQSVDFMAHFWGLIMGVPLGVLGEFFRRKKSLSPRMQQLLAFLAIVIPLACWGIAIANHHY